MSIWGKLIGGAAGLALGGPLGALIGGVAGHAVDVYSEERAPVDATHSVAFTIGVIALSAKMAKADGEVTPEEIAAFREIIHVPPEEMPRVQRFFDMAKRDSAGFEGYARQVAGLFRDNRAVLEEVLGGLFHIAKADGRVPQAELDYLRAVAGIFGFDQACFARLCALWLGAGWAERGGVATEIAADYQVLGVTPDSDDDTLRAAYRRLVQETHPDRMMAAGLPPDAVALATRKLAAINAAWDRLRADRARRQPRTPQLDRS